MADSRMPDDFFDELEAHLPPEQPVGSQGGRPRIDQRTVVKVLWWVLATGARWEDVPQEMGCSGRTAHRRLEEWEELGLWGRLHLHLLKRLRKAGELEHDTVVVDSVTLRAFGGGDRSGPSPVDRRRPGCKHTLLVDETGVPLLPRRKRKTRPRLILKPPFCQSFLDVFGADCWFENLDGGTWWQVYHGIPFPGLYKTTAGWHRSAV